MRLITWTAVFACTLALSSAAMAASVLMVSIDGLRPGDVVEAGKRGLQIPTLRGLMTSGSYASGVRNVLPTVTYPNHTTLITGVWPARHGIAANEVFDPLGKNKQGWYWYASDIKVETLWDVVHAGRRTVASLGWPVSVGTRAIDYNVPEYWRAQGSPDDPKLIAALSTPGLTAELEQATGHPLETIADETAAGDEVRAAYAAHIIETRHPALTTVHLVNLDHIQHKAGPDTPEAHESLERIDAALGRLITAARYAEPDLVVAVVSDHGFAPLAHAVNLKIAFTAEGLMTLDDDKRAVKGWDAAPWGAGGAAAVVLARPEDPALRAKTAALLEKLRNRPELGIAQVIDQAGVAAKGGTPLAAFFIGFKSGYDMGNALSGEVVTPSTDKGMHGYFPDMPEMRSTFLIAGPAWPRKGALGEIDMRDIAPTLAKLLNVSLPHADGKPLY